MASSSSYNVFYDLSLYHGKLNLFTIQQLNEFIRMLNTQMGLSIRTSQAKKADIILRITSQLDFWKKNNDMVSYGTFGRLYNHQKAEIAGTKSRYRDGYQAAPPPAAPYRPPVSSAAAVAPPRYSSASAAALNSWDNRAVGSSAHDFAPPPRPTRWRESPMVSVVEPISSMILVPASMGAADRKSATTHVMLNDDFRVKILDSLANPQKSPQYSLRLYCTPSTYYTPTQGPLGSGATEGLPVEFPPTSEIRVNNYLIAASLKGVKKKIGSCPPANLHKAKIYGERMIDLNPSGRSSVELIHINQSQNTAGPKLAYYFQICLTKSLSPDDLVKKVQGSKHRTAAEVVRELTAPPDEDEDDITVGALTVGLKCPLSYIRMSNPMRSTRCNHIQCFDAASWFQINEQTPTWTCPICEQGLKIEHLFIDDFTGSILKTVPSSVDEVVVEPNAQWHTADKKYGDPIWLQAHAASRPASASVSLRSSPVNDTKGKGKAEDVEVFVLDSDDEGSDVPLAARFPQPPKAPSSARDETPVPVGTSDEPIDLTFSSDEDEPPVRPPPPRRPSSGDTLTVPSAGTSAIKRSATEEASSEIDKRPRYDQINGGGSSEAAQPYRSFVPPARSSSTSSRPGSAYGYDGMPAPVGQTVNGSGGSGHYEPRYYDQAYRPAVTIPGGTAQGDLSHVNPDLRPAPTYRDNVGPPPSFNGYR